MTGKPSLETKKIRTFPPPPKDFDPFAASQKDLLRHGLPLRPDPQIQPGMAALWEKQAARYRHFDHIEPRLAATLAPKPVLTIPSIGPDPIESCGYQLFSSAAPFIALFATFTVPDLHFSPGGIGPNQFHTFVGIGFLDLHVEMTVDSNQNVTSQITAQGTPVNNMPVRPGDVISCSMCLDNKPPATARFFIANETTSQTTNFQFDSGFPPAVTVNAGVTRGGFNFPVHPLARFGIVYFDEISAYTTNGFRSLTSGQAITMVEGNKTLARPDRISDFTFKANFVAA